MANTKDAKAYLDGFGTVRRVLELDHLTIEEILRATEPESYEDPLLTPWKRGYNAAIRVAFGH